MTPWNADKHVNDVGGYGLGSTIKDELMVYLVFILIYLAILLILLSNLLMIRPSWEMVDLTITYKPAGDASWYAQLSGYNVTDEYVPFWRGVNAGTPHGAFSAPSHYVLRVGYYW